MPLWAARRPAGAIATVTPAPRRPFTVSPPRRAACSPLRHRRRRETCGMADVLVAAGIVAFVAAMLGLIWCLERI
jgi:hypothetical protein